MGDRLPFFDRRSADATYSANSDLTTRCPGPLLSNVISPAATGTVQMSALRERRITVTVVPSHARNTRGIGYTVVPSGEITFRLDLGAVRPSATGP